MESIPYLYKSSKLFKALVLNHPSKVCKSPYLADIKVFDNKDEIIEENVMAHTPALGCGGLVKQGAWVFCTKSTSEKTKSKYIINQALLTDLNVYIGINPMLASPIVKQLLLSDKIPGFKNIKNLKQEVTIGESRFDFSFEVNNKGKKLVYLEVKNVPIADVVDVEDKKRKKMDLSQYDTMQKIAIFPHGYRKNVKDPISERAVKHTNHLADLVNGGDGDVICAIVFLIQRTDVVKFKPSVIDPVYCKSLYDALETGVRIIPVCIEWKGDECYFHKIVPLVEKETD